ncbi:MAG: hypothetical protein ABR583_02280 [Gaiellaceae bacterium]
MAAAVVLVLISAGVLLGAGAGAAPVQAGVLRVAKPPTKTQIVSRTGAAVRATRARLVRLDVRMPNKHYKIVVSVNDPAAYLKQRVDRLVRIVIRLTAVERRFARLAFTIRAPSGVVFRYSRVGPVDAATSSWWVRPDLAGCAENIGFGIEIAPDGGAPPCPAP